MPNKQLSKKKRQLLPRNVHYVLSTHWDREWYQTFQDYRRRLVRLMDRTLDDLLSGKLGGPFTTDGQSILIDDYLEIRPERRSEVEGLARSGKLNIGPWFVLPDEWLVSGESLIRNLRLGRESARGYGGIPSNAGFVCDLFGHISQLPQILNGFGIHGAFVWRGIEPRNSAHLRWQGSDGSELLCFRFGRAGYCDYTYDVRHCTEHGYTYEPEKAVQELDIFLSKEADRSGVPPLLVFDGGDHLEYDDDHYQTLFNRKTSDEFPYQVEHSTLDRYLEEMSKYEKDITDIFYGEMRQTAASPVDKDTQWLIPGVLSSRVWIKQQNAECQALLCHWAEPFSAFTKAVLGAEHPTQFLATAWKWLLMNHPHDSICGCSIDEVHEDMKYRFSQCLQIAEAQTNESLTLIARAVEGEIEANEIRVVVANPLTRFLDETLELKLEIPIEWGTYNEFFGFEPKPGFRLFLAGTGEEISYQLLSMSPPRVRRRIWTIKYPEAYQVREVGVSLRLALPATGYTTLIVREGKKSKKDGVYPEGMMPTRHPSTPGLATSECSMENALLSVRIESNGSLTITEKRSGQTYSRLLTFEDVADIGDGWYHGVAVNDLQVASTASSSDVMLLHDGPFQCTFRIRTHLRVPSKFEGESRQRSSTFIELLCDSTVTLRANSSRVEVVTNVDNTACDHRLRVLFPSGADASTYFSDSTFDVVEREIRLPFDNHIRRELAVETSAQQTWTAIGDGTRGLAIVSKGLHEATVRDQPDRPIALTLFRSTQRTVITDGQPEGQLLGPLTFSFWIVPFSKTLPSANLCQLGQLLGAGLRTAQIQPRHFFSTQWSGKRLPAMGSLLEIEGDAICTSIREVSGAIEVRIFNPSNSTVSVTFRLSILIERMFTTAQRVDFESQPLGKPISLKKPLSLGAKKIVTLRLN